MVELRLQLTPRSLDVFRRMVDALSASFEDTGTVRFRPPASIDEESCPSWMEELHTQLDEDLRTLRKLVENNDFGVTVVRLSEASAEAVMRAASALRLKIRDTLLRGISDGELEAGSVDFSGLNPVEQQAYATYAFLAGLQELLIDGLDHS